MFHTIFGAVFAVYRWSYLRRAIPTTATIIDLIEDKGGVGRRHSVYRPVYIFTDQRGQSVKVISSAASFPPVGEVGDKIEVLYDPDNPQHSIQNDFFSIWGIPALSFGLGGIWVIIFTTTGLLRQFEG
ncbi:MAG: DUF3592 domain-containing protein [Cyanobacteriota bacterium]